METRKEIQKRVNDHICTVEHFDDLFNGNRALAYKKLGQMVKAGEIKYTWVMPSGKKGGRGRKSWTNRRIPEDKRPHEIKVTSVVLALGFEFTRFDDVDAKLLPDWEMIIDGERCYGELDNNANERGAKIDDRLSIYHTVGNRVFWVVDSEARRQSLRKKDRRNKHSFFGLFREVVANPTGSVWLDVNNQFVTLENRGISSRTGDVTAMAERVQSEVMNGNGRAHGRRHYEAPATPPQQVLIVPQQPVPQMPQLPQLSAEQYLGIQQFQMSLQSMPVIVPLVMCGPTHFANKVAEQMDEISNYADGEEFIDLDVEFKIR